MRTGLTGGYVLQALMYYMRACLTVGHVFQEYIYYEWTCFIKIHDLK